MIDAGNTATAIAELVSKASASRLNCKVFIRPPAREMHKAILS